MLSKIWRFVSLTSFSDFTSILKANMRILIIWRFKLTHISLKMIIFADLILPHFLIGAGLLFIPCMLQHPEVVFIECFEYLSIELHNFWGEKSFLHIVWKLHFQNFQLSIHLCNVWIYFAALSQTFTNTGTFRMILIGGAMEYFLLRKLKTTDFFDQIAKFVHFDQILLPQVAIHTPANFTNFLQLAIF